MPSSSAPHDPAPAPAPSEAGSLRAASLYDVLRLPSTASAEQLRQSFRRLSKLYHPDTTSLPAAEAARAFEQLRRAYAVLGDPRSRQLYDEQRRLPSPPTPQLRPLSSIPLRRALSGGEWFALLLLAAALVLSLVLGIGVAWARGAELMRWPSWWTDLHPAGEMVESTASVAPLADAPDGPSS
jgi:preprotein translocase subunit Sec63